MQLQRRSASVGRRGARADDGDATAFPRRLRLAGLSRFAGRLVPVVLTTVGLSAATGCTLKSASQASCSSGACFTEHYFDAYRAPAEECSPVQSADRLDATLALALHWGGGANDGDVVDQASDLQRFFRPYGLTFETDRAAVDAQLAYAMRGSQQELDAALDKAGVPLDGTLTADQQRSANAALGAIIFADLRRFVTSHSEARTVNLVILDHLMSPELSAALFPGSSETIVGFTVSPALFNRVSASDPEYDLYGMTGLTVDFTPTVFIGRADVGDLAGSPDNVIAHEMGHALGLVHTTDAGNLMVPGQNRACEETLSAEQLTELRQTLGGAPLSPAKAAAAVDWLPRVMAAAVRSRQVRYADETLVRP